MPGKHTLELQANKDIDGTTVFESVFPSQPIHELMLEFDPKRVGAPVATLKGDNGAVKEIHPIPLRGREGRFSQQVGGTETWSSIRVHMVRNTKGHLVKVKLLGGAAASPTP